MTRRLRGVVNGLPARFCNVLSVCYGRAGDVGLGLTGIDGPS